MGVSLKLKIKKMSNRLIIYIPKKIRRLNDFSKRELIKIEITKGKRTIALITKFNPVISLSKQITNDLNLKEGVILKLTLNKINQKEIDTGLLKDKMIDIFYFIPKKTRKGSHVLAENFIKNGEKFLRLKSFHLRGSGSQVEIRRFLDLYEFGKFLGQLQSEGTKNYRDKIEFSNKSHYEHTDFLNFLKYLGILKDKIFIKLDYHSSINDIEQMVNDFSKKVGFKINYVSSSSKSRGGSGFKSIVRNTLLSEIILGSMDYMRKLLVLEDWSSEISIFAEGFFAKILNGDGSFELIKKDRKTPQARVIIYDGNNNYLDDYKIILEKFGFSPKISKKFGYVRSYCSLSQAEKLKRIGAFSKNSNEGKLNQFIQTRLEILGSSD